MGLTFWSKLQLILNKALRANRGFKKSLSPAESLPQGIGDALASPRAQRETVALACGGFGKGACQCSLQKQWLSLESVSRIKKRFIYYPARPRWSARSAPQTNLSTKIPLVVDKRCRKNLFGAQLSLVSMVAALWKKNWSFLLA